MCRSKGQDMKIGSGALAPHSIKSHHEAGLKSCLQKKNFRHLPHIDSAGYYQFVTFRTHDSVDEFVRKWGFSPAFNKKPPRSGTEVPPPNPNKAKVPYPKEK